MSSASTDITVLTYNLWGIFNSRMREARMAVFAQKVKNYDIVLLQEQFSPDDFDLIISSLPRDIRESRYFRRFPSGFYGSGSAVISRFPIRSAFFHTYPLQGYPEMVLHGDFFANKGCALIHLDVPVEEDGAIVNHDVLLYTTHLVAVYQKVSQLPSWKNERYLPYRISQAISLADFIRTTSKPTDDIIIGGDFNASQRSLEVQVLLILLKRCGYRMRSVLPTPGAVIDHAGTPQECQASRALYTFSTENAFNASKTSYFKLLNMQSDIPAQIDHMFFNASSLALQPFHNCPDANPNFPFEIQVDDHTSIPSGVVVFTNNMVAPAPSPSWREAIAERVDAVAGYVPNETAKKRVRRIATQIRPKVSAAADRGDVATLYPMSDHYGVAARLRFRSVATSRQSPVAASLSADVLSEDERAVLGSVTQYLQAFVTKLRNQVTISRYMAAVSLAALVLHVYAVGRAGRAQEAHTATAMRELCVLAGPKPPASAANKDDDKSSVEKIKAGVSWVIKGVRRAWSTPAGTGEASHAAQVSAVDFEHLSRQLSHRPLWASPGGSAAIATSCGLTAFVSVAVGTFQRAGNANVLEEQVRLLTVI